MLVKDPCELLIGKLPEPMRLTFPKAQDLIRKLSNNIHRVISNRTRKNSNKEIEVITVKVIHYNNGFLGEYKIIPEIIVDCDGTIRHVMRAISAYSEMPHYITVHIEEENSGIRCINLKVFGINKIVWGTIKEVQEIVDAIELVKQTKQIILDRLELDGIYVH